MFKRKEIEINSKAYLERKMNTMIVCIMLSVKHLILIQINYQEKLIDPGNSKSILDMKEMIKLIYRQYFQNYRKC